MNVAIILSGGTGLRLGSEIPKQYIEVNDKMVIDYCLKTFANNNKIEAIQIVANEQWREKITRNFKKNDLVSEKFKGFSLPGKTRQGSILNALEDIKKYADDNSFVIIHDAARPLVSDELINNCFVNIEASDGVIPVIDVKDTMYLVNDNKDKIVSLIERGTLVSGQTPEVFILGKYYNVNVNLDRNTFEKINGSTEPAVLGGLSISIIKGEEINFKITTKQDLERFKQIIINKNI